MSFCSDPQRSERPMPNRSVWIDDAAMRPDLQPGIADTSAVAGKACGPKLNAGCTKKVQKHWYAAKLCPKDSLPELFSPLTIRLLFCSTCRDGISYRTAVLQPLKRTIRAGWCRLGQRQIANHRRVVSSAESGHRRSPLHSGTKSDCVFDRAELEIRPAALARAIPYGLQRESVSKTTASGCFADRFKYRCRTQRKADRIRGRLA